MALHTANPILLVHYHEIGLKGRNRSVFERKLISNIQSICKDLPIEKITKISGRVLVSLSRDALAGAGAGAAHAVGGVGGADGADGVGGSDGDRSAGAVDDGGAGDGVGTPGGSDDAGGVDAAGRFGEADDVEGFVPGGLDSPRVRKLFNIVKNIPGVARVSLGWRTNRELDVMMQLAADVLRDALPFETFKVESRRSNTDFPLHTMDMSRQIGSYLCERFPDKKVKMDRPDAIVHVEVIQGSTYVYARTERGTGGLPVGSAGKFISLLSTGIDSPVAMWRIMHRGGVAIGLHFSGAPETDDSSEYLVRDICDAMQNIGGIKRLYIAKIGEYQRRIADEVPARLRVVFFRRLMFTVANELAWREHAKAIVTGESLGQVASQTMDNIAVVDAVAKYPVFRPLIGTDKTEIIEQAKQLGTYELSIHACADCCTLFLPDSPETHARFGEVNALSEKMDFEAWARQICDAMQVIEYR